MPVRSVAKERAEGVLTVGAGEERRQVAGRVRDREIFEERLAERSLAEGAEERGVPFVRDAQGERRIVSRRNDAGVSGDEEAGAAS
jgi:hypothetical protein